MVKYMYYLILLSFFSICLLPSVYCADESFRVLALHEKEKLEDKIIGYNDSVVELSLELIDIKDNYEWLKLKITGINESNRFVPVELTSAIKRKTDKAIKYKQRKKRFESLLKEHLLSLKNLHEKVLLENRGKLPAWWTYNKKIKALLLPAEKSKNATIIKDAKNAVFFSSNEESSGHSKVALELFQTIRKEGLSEWLAICDTENGLRLDVNLPIVFGRGNMSIASEYRSFLKKLSKIIKPYQYQVELKGNMAQTVSTPEHFESNMQLSLGRASRIAKEMAELGLSPAKMKVSGKSSGDNKGMLLGRSVEMSVIITEKDSNV